ncbi:hypothetical protein [Streptomyces sp. NBC_00989]|uniref:hypothetical protein n=1 Tax=Streptomyces sp. NBC_00989 TaxID=2903705 RepID=UPI0038698516|nr:hypothetical protein OG714_13165 [Streptomyces sp. NBC_00989]
MAGRDFGHHLGLPRALSGLPLSPFVAAYGDLVAAQHGLGLRHLGEVLLPPGVGGLGVLDGVYVPSGGRGRRRVDVPFLEDLARAPAPAAGLAGLLAEAQRRDPQAVRRVVLYQLIGLLQDRPVKERPHTAAQLGVHPDEVAGLVAAARLRPALDRRERQAAESLAGAWEQHRLHRVRTLLERLPHGTDDPALRSLRTESAARFAVVDGALLAARRAEDDRDAETAGAEYLRALREVTDDRRALRGLVRVHRPRAGEPAALDAELGLDHVRLAWDEAGSDGDWRLLCLYRDERGAPTVREVAARDEALVLGSAVRYAALPLRDGLVDGPPLVSHRLLVTPEVEGLTLTDGPERIEGTWKRPPGAADVTVERTGPDATAEQLTLHAEGFTATGLPPGRHTVRVVCHYRSPGRQPVASPGVRTTRTVHPWPSPVRTLTARPEGETVRFAWSGAEDTDVRLVEWPGEPPAPGTELHTRDLPAGIGWPERDGALCPPPGVSVRVAAVAVLGERALAGPGVDVEVLRPVTGLAARRLPGGEAEVSLDWPGDTPHLRVSWDTGERSLTAHAYRRGGLRLPVGPRAVRVRVAAAPHVPGAVVVVPDSAEVLLPPDTAIGYQLVRAPRRLLGRGRPPLLRVTLSTPEGGDHDDAPEFVCVARSGTLRPRSAADGTTLLRIPGTDLLRLGTVEQELPAAPCPAPYTLRGFLLGEHAASVRLEEPSPATLVVR